MSPSPPARRPFRARQIRRGVQIVFLLVFFGLVLLTRFPSGGKAAAGLAWFFHFDPLILLATGLSAHAVAGAALWALVVVGLTLVAGRVFCGWICPLGTVHAIAGWLLRRVWPDRKRREHWSRWQLAKYYVLIAFLVMAVLGSHWGTIWDPLVLLYRSTAAGLLPGAQWAVEESTTPLAQSDNRTAQAVSKYAAEPAYTFLRDNVFGGVDRQRQAFWGGGLILALFFGLLLLNRYRLRFWCRYLCPLGGLLGLLAWRPLLRRTVKPESCDQCDLCGKGCHGAAAVVPGDHGKPSECFVCLDCTDQCRRGSLAFTWTWPWRGEPAVQRVDLSKRAVLASGVSGLAALMLLRIGPEARGRTLNADLIRPPGARPEREFLQRCTGCGLCLQICPTGGLQPTFLEAGLEGLWTPHLLPQIGPCSYSCNLCTQVCPPQAIAPLTLEEKQKVKIGLAFIDASRCLPYAFGRTCTVCEECCPVPDKAIYLIDAKFRTRGGEQTVKQPQVDPARCTGCGQCEKMCVLRDRPAIRVSATNESRTCDNQPILGEEGPY